MERKLGKLREKHSFSAYVKTFFLFFKVSFLAQEWSLTYFHRASRQQFAFQLTCLH